jgi:hypothetical protein
MEPSFNRTAIVAGAGEGCNGTQRAHADRQAFRVIGTHQVLEHLGFAQSGFECALHSHGLLTDRLSWEGLLRLDARHGSR